MRDRVQVAQERGIYVSVMLFEGWTLHDGVKPSDAPDNWSLRSHPFHRENNIQGIGDSDGRGETPEVYSLMHDSVNRVQAAYIRKVVETVNSFDNVLYEAINEGGGKVWNWWVVKTIQDIEKNMPKQHPVGNTGHGVEDLASLLASPADWVPPGKRDGYGENPPAWNQSKVSILDTDHIWGIGGSADWVWKAFTRGHNPIFMDTYQHVLLGKGRTDQWDGVRLTMGATRHLAQQIELATMLPRPDLSSTTYCLANPGDEYVVYQPKSGPFFGPLRTRRILDPMATTDRAFLTSKVNASIHRWRRDLDATLGWPHRVAIEETRILNCLATLTLRVLPRLT